ncbi:MAG TPA: hypothetical protein DIT19_04590 [Desulfonauticus sp.]|nr:MAG: TPR repeat-containing protein [Desulfonauticus sp. 38_4375]HCO12485.1 hypothetical protein [Desulfonauticus sp.]
MNIDEYIEDLQLKIAKSPDCAIHHYNLGVAYLSKREFERAKDAFKNAIMCSSEMAEAYVQLGGIAMHEGDLDSCYMYNKKASEIRPRFAVPYGNMGFIYLQKGEIDKAIKILKRAISLDPKFVQAYTTLSSAYLIDGDVERCIEHATKAIELQPMFGPAYNNLGLAYMEKQEYEKAKEYFTKAQETGYEVAPEVLADLEEALKNKV